MAGKRVSLKKNIEDVRRWAAEGKDDEWIADALGSTASSVQSFRSRNGIPHYKRSTEATFASLGMDTGSETYEGVIEERDGRHAIWFDPGVADSISYEVWKLLQNAEVRVSPERIVLLRRSPEQLDGEEWHGDSVPDRSEAAASRKAERQMALS